MLLRPFLLITPWIQCNCEKYLQIAFLKSNVFWSHFEIISYIESSGLIFTNGLSRRLPGQAFALSWSSFCCFHLIALDAQTLCYYWTKVQSMVIVFSLNGCKMLRLTTSFVSLNSNEWMFCLLRLTTSFVFLWILMNECFVLLCKLNLAVALHRTGWSCFYRSISFESKISSYLWQNVAPRKSYYQEYDSDYFSPCRFKSLYQISTTLIRNKKYVR